jgi:ribonuclease VapC
VNVLDASVILAHFNGEPGGERFPEFMQQASVSVVTDIEVVTKLLDGGATFEPAERALAELDLPTIDVTKRTASGAAALRNRTRQQGLSLADRICLATAEMRGAIAATRRDRASADAATDVQVALVR